MAYFLVSTEGLPDRLWFRTREDFAAGMNYAAICSRKAGVIILAFVLMSNHVHFVLRCTFQEAKAFIDMFKSLFSRYCRKKYGIVELLRNNSADIREIETKNESLEKAIAYVMMNPVSANICLSPSQYPWGSGAVCFSETTISGTMLGKLSYRKQVALIHSNVKLPAAYMLSIDGYIHPSSYIPVKEVEAIFRSPKRLNYFLMRSSKARKDESTTPSFRDQIILAAAGDLCISLFRKNSITELSPPQMADLLRQLRFRFSADMAQLARIVGIPYNKATQLMDDFPDS